MATPHQFDSFAYPPRGMTRAQAARYIGIGTTTFDELVSEGIIPKPKKIRTRRLWDRVEIDAAFSELPVDGQTMRDALVEKYRIRP